MPAEKVKVTGEGHRKEQYRRYKEFLQQDHDRIRKTLEEDIAAQRYSAPIRRQLMSIYEEQHSKVLEYLDRRESATNYPQAWEKK